jgi:dynein heavy chain
MNEKKELVLKPTIESVQVEINNAAKEVLSCSKKIFNWGQDDKKEADKEPFYKQIATDKEIVRVILLLTGSVKGTEEELNICKRVFTEFEKYYKKEPEDYVNDFVNKFKDGKPILSAYRAQLSSLDKLQIDIEAKPANFSIGAISLNNDNIKESVNLALMTIKKKLCQNLHDQSKSDLENITEKIKTMKISIERRHDDIESLVGIMEEIAKVREQEYEMRLELAPVREM